MFLSFPIVYSEWDYFQSNAVLYQHKQLANNIILSLIPQSP